MKQHLWVFCNSLIENPTFDSQTKETLTLKPKLFGSECVLSEKFFKSILHSEIYESIIAFAKAKEKVKINKVLSSNKYSLKYLAINKLEDANLAGTKHSGKCTLIITEGESAKSLAMAGVEIVGRDYYGVYPLKGKLLNVRDANYQTVTNNKEIQDLIKILGLRQGVDYSDSTKSLRYGSIMIMTDQDHDGSHIKGLIINFIHFYWPSLLFRNEFVKEFITPIVKASKGDVSHSFFTINDYKAFWDKIKQSPSGWKIKYYKGLGTSTNSEAKEYFKNIEHHRITFSYQNKEDDEAITLAFSKENAEQRRKWLSAFEPNNTNLDLSSRFMRYKEFIDKELIFFSNSDNIRSIPSLLDGFKPSQRKIIYACFKRNLKNEVKVAQLAGYISEHSAYHHGEDALSANIISLAQDFIGTNNINLLQPIGQFGNRYLGTKGAASSRYIFTCLSKLTRIIFKEEDDSLLTYIVEEGQQIEPVT